MSYLGTPPANAPITEGQAAAAIDARALRKSGPQALVQAEIDQALANLGLPLATLAEAQAGTDNSRLMTALRVAQAIAALATSVPSGSITAFAGRAAPSGWLLCDGSAVSRTTFAALFNVLCPALGSFTVTIASPAVVTLNGHGLRTGDRIRLTTSGALPTGLATGTDYFVNRIDANTFNLRTTPGGANINTSGTQSGTHNAQFFPYGAGDGSTTFGLPDLRGNVPVGADAMGGTAAGRMTNAGSGIFGEGLGQSGGAQTHQLTVAQLPSHSHSYQPSSGATSSPSVVGAANASYNGGTPNNTTGNTGSDQAHNNTQPSIVTNYIIKT